MQSLFKVNVLVLLAIPVLMRLSGQWTHRDIYHPRAVIMYVGFITISVGLLAAIETLEKFIQVQHQTASSEKKKPPSKQDAPLS